MELVYASATELLGRLRAGELSAHELTTALIARIEALNPRLNAVVATRFEAALAEARAADAARARRAPVGALHGLPMTIKDTIEVTGLPTTCGAPALRDYRPAEDAEAVRRLRQAGAIVLGKTNVPLFGGDLQTFNEVYGETRNPWAAERTPGGSSGGAAAALAAGMVPAEIGSDLCGSLRIPPHSCGICGFKPSYGAVSQRGSLLGGPGSLLEPDLCVVGPLARFADDLQLLFEVLRARRAPAADAIDTGRLRVAAWLEAPICPLGAGVREVLETALDALSSNGVRIDPAARPAFAAEKYFETHCALMYAAMSITVPDDIYDYFRRRAASARPGGATPTDELAAGLTQTHRDWLRASEAGARLRRVWADFFRDHDLLLCPVAPTTAAPLDQRRLDQRYLAIDGVEYPYLQHLFWVMLASTGHLPAAVVPAGIAADGLPVGLQIIGPAGADDRVLACARRVEQVLGGFRPPAALAA